MDNKYGQLYTAADVRKIVAAYTAADEFDLHNDKEFEGILSKDEYHFPRSEPQFVIRGKDNSGQAFVEDYRDTHAVRGAPAAFIDLVQGTVNQFADFREREQSFQEDYDEAQDRLAAAQTQEARGHITQEIEDRQLRPSRMKDPD